MIGGVSTARHVVVGVTIACTTLLGTCVGETHPEQFDAKTIVVARQDDQIRVTEYVDIDFGSFQRRGYQREIPNDFGVPTDVVAFSPDANDDVTTAQVAGQTRIRVGDPDVTFTDQHRYELSYTLPDPMFDEMGLDLDVVAPADAFSEGDNQTLEFNVVVTGFELENPTCDVGAFGDVGGCELVDDGSVYRVTLEPLASGDGLTIGGVIVGDREVVEVVSPPLPERRTGDNLLLIALLVAGLGLLGALPVYFWARHRGRNEVFSGGAADAAFGRMPAPGTDAALMPPTHLVRDDHMDELATIEFAPPKGLDPWEGGVLLDEKVDDGTVEAWLSGMVGKEAIEITEVGDDVSIASGPRRSELDEVDAALLDGILGISDPYVTGTYDPAFKAAWAAILAHQKSTIAASGWWKHRTPGTRPGVGRGGWRVISFGIVFVVVWSVLGDTPLSGLANALPLAIMLAIGVPALVAYFAYRALLPARSAQGSALALRTESFRRFLEASEAQHVEWAWERGVLREYSAWAVALYEAAAWSKALEGANVPEPARLATTPILLHSYATSMAASHTAPSSSGSGSGGFGGGGVGGGGGGGSSGSW